MSSNARFILFNNNILLGVSSTPPFALLIGINIIIDITRGSISQISSISYIRPSIIYSITSTFAVGSVLSIQIESLLFYLGLVLGGISIVFLLYKPVSLYIGGISIVSIISVLLVKPSIAYIALPYVGSALGLSISKSLFLPVNETSTNSSTVYTTNIQYYSLYNIP